MTSIRKPLDSFAVFAMVILCLVWGFQQVAIKVTSPEIHPVMQVGIRSGIAAALVFAFTRLRGQTFDFRNGTMRPGLVAGVLFGLEFFFISLGLKFTTASHMSVFLYTTPIFTALGLHAFVKGERLRAVQWIGVLLAFAGIAAAFLNGATADTPHRSIMLLGDGLGILAGLFWAATTVLVRSTSLSEAPPAQTLFYQLGVGAVVLLLIAKCAGYASIQPLTGIALASMTYQSIIVCFASYLMWFWMLRRYLASRLSVFSFLSPLFGVGFGVLLMHDPVNVWFAAGALLVLGGILLVNHRKS